MKLVLPLLAILASANAQYFSAGWSPGQKVEQEARAPNFDPKDMPAVPPAKSEPFRLSSLLDINTYLTLPPAVALFEKLGINITEKVAAASLPPWDERVVLITDDNYDELIVNEPLTEQQEKDRVWMIMISITAARQEGISKYMDAVFDSAFNETVIAGDLPNVRWGRIDYVNVTYITTKWGIWQAPVLVLLRERGQSLRFYKPYQIRIREDAIREFLQEEGWKGTPTWSTAYAPGGDREYIMIFIAKWMTKVFNKIVLIPRWVLFIASSSIASILIGLLHRPSKNAPTESAPKTKAIPNEKPVVEAAPQPPTSAPVEPAAPAQASSSSKASAKKKTAKSSNATTPAPTDSEHESTAPAKRTSTRQRKTKKS